MSNDEYQRQEFWKNKPDLTNIMINYIKGELFQEQIKETKKNFGDLDFDVSYTKPNKD